MRKTFGDKIRDLSLYKSTSQMADLFNVTPQTIRNWKGRQVVPNKGSDRAQKIKSRLYHSRYWYERQKPRETFKAMKERAENIHESGAQLLEHKIAFLAENNKRFEEAFLDLPNRKYIIDVHFRWREGGQYHTIESQVAGYPSDYQRVETLIYKFYKQHYDLIEDKKPEFFVAGVYNA